MIIIFLLFILTVINCNRNTVPSTSFISGMYYDVKKIDSLIYCATARGLEIFCLKDNHIRLLSRYATDGVARAVDIPGRYAFIADDYKGLCILDVSNPQIPKYIVSYNTCGQTRDVVIQNNYAYLADYNKGFIILDVSNVASPCFVGSYDKIDCACWVEIRDTLAYVGILGAPFKIINITNHANPHIVGEFPQDYNNYCSDICFDDTLAYINCRMQFDDSIITFAVVNIKDPIHPQYIAGISLPSTGRGIVKASDFVYTNSYDEGVFIINVINPDSPSIVGQYKISNYSGNSLVVCDKMLIVPHLVDGFSIAKVSNIQKVTSIFHKENIRWEYLNIDDSLNYLYLLGNVEDVNLVRHSFLKIIDMTKPESLICYGELGFVGRGSISDRSYDFPYLLMTNRRGHPRCDTVYTEIIDVRNPYKPNVVKSIKEGGIIEFHLPNIYALHKNILKRGNINNPNVWIDDLCLPFKGNDFVIRDTIGYIITNDSLMIINIRSGERISACTHNRFLATNLSLNYPYIASTYTLGGARHTYGFLIFNVHDEQTPVLIIDTTIYGDTATHRNRPLLTSIYSVSCEFRDTLLYMGRGVYGFDVWTIKPPKTPVRLLTQDTPYIATHCYPNGNGNIRVCGDYVFLIDYIVGLEIYKLSSLMNRKVNKQPVHRNVIK